MAQLITSFLLSVILYLSLHISFAHHLCNPEDAHTLLQFKEEMVLLNEPSGNFWCDYNPKIITWNKSVSSDCCTWDGVTCHSITGHVIGLDLTCSGLVGGLHHNSSLFLLSHLQQLNLAFNNFSISEISPNLGGLSKLTHLNLSSSSFNGTVPSKISHLSELVSLDLSWNKDTTFRFNPHDFQNLLQNLTRIVVLDLSNVEVSTVLPTNWSSSLTFLNLQNTQVYGKLSNSFLFNLPRLQTLILSVNRDLSVGLPKRNFSINTPLRTLDLSSTNCSSGGTLDYIASFASTLHSLGIRNCQPFGYFPYFVGNLSEIVELDLSMSDFTGNISSEILNIPKLRELYLNDNSFTGQFPSHFGNLSELRILDLSNNLISGALPSNVSRLEKLEILDLRNNSFSGTIPYWVFSRPLLTRLRLNNNHFTGQINKFIAASFVNVDFSGNHLDGPIPVSVSQLVHLCKFDLSWNNLNGSLKFSMFANLSRLTYLGLSGNELSFKSEKRTNMSFPFLDVLGLSSCEITEFPYFIRNSNSLRYLQLSNNKIRGQIPNWIPWTSLSFFNLSRNSLSSMVSFNTLPPESSNLQVLDLNSNKFQDTLPPSLCSFIQLDVLDLSYNNFSGSIPECFGNLSVSLSVMNLGENRLTGSISMTFPKDNNLNVLNLNRNLFEGPLPRSLANCTYLQVLDLGNNMINDTFPTFLENLQNLQVLVLKSNRFFGSIRNLRNETSLPQLQIFDISLNNLTGALPHEIFRSFKAMTTSHMDPTASTVGTYDAYIGNEYIGYRYSMIFATKGQELHFESILTILVAIDVSSNNFTGEIPETIGNLDSLIMLNMSHNKFLGKIPSAFGKLKSLQSLDLSWNQIDGEIPAQLALLTFLQYLNLSQNHLVGRIPQGKQFNTFLNDSYYGNLGLCGFPVTGSCGGTYPPPPPSQGSHEDDEDSSFWVGFTWQSVLIGNGFGLAIGCLVHFTGKPKWIVRNLEELCLYGLFLLGKKELCKQLKKSWGRGQQHRRRNNN